jgi:hypothetical protein
MPDKLIRLLVNGCPGLRYGREDHRGAGILAALADVARFASDEHEVLSSRQKWPDSVGFF